jgi:hypothetical protein
MGGLSCTHSTDGRARSEAQDPQALHRRPGSRLDDDATTLRADSWHRAATGASQFRTAPTWERRIAADGLNFRVAPRQQMQRRDATLTCASAKIPISFSAAPFNHTAHARCLNRAAKKHARKFLVPNNTPRAPQSLRTSVTIAEKIRSRNKEQKEPRTGRNQEAGTGKKRGEASVFGASGAVASAGSGLVLRRNASACRRGVCVQNRRLLQ